MLALTHPGSVIILAYGAERVAVRMFFEMASAHFDVEYVSDEEIQAVKAQQERCGDKTLLGGNVKIALMRRRKDSVSKPAAAAAASGSVADVQVC